ncbi:MAG: MarR family transcriptional regulator [Pseudomonadota bacterium]
MSGDMSGDTDRAKTPERELTDFLSYRIVCLHHALNAQATYVLDQIAGLTLSQWRILAMVGSGTAMTARDIVRKSTIDPAIISRTTRSLEDAGLLETSRPDTDRRVLEMRLTEAGKQTYDRILPHMHARQNLLVNALTPAEQKAIFPMLEKLERAAENRDFDL